MSDTPTLRRAALTAVACNTMMLQVCDDLKSTTLYTQRRKQLINTLTGDLEGFMRQLYTDMGEAEEMQYYELVSTIQAGAEVLTTLQPGEIARFAAFWKIYRTGQFAEVDEAKYEGMKRCGML